MKKAILIVFCIIILFIFVCGCEKVKPTSCSGETEYEADIVDDYGNVVGKAPVKVEADGGHSFSVGMIIPHTNSTINSTNIN